MALISISSVVKNPQPSDYYDLPTPSDFQVGIMDLSKAERNANGWMIIERIATKRKLELSWNYLSRSQLSAILVKVSTVSFYVKYMDPAQNTYKESEFYCGDRSAGMIDFINGVPRYKDVKFSLIER